MCLCISEHKIIVTIVVLVVVIALMFLMYFLWKKKLLCSQPLEELENPEVRCTEHARLTSTYSDSDIHDIYVHIYICLFFLCSHRICWMVSVLTL